MKKIKKLAIIGVSILVLFTSCSKQYDTVKSNKNDMKSSQISEKGFEYRINSNKLFDSDRVICEKLIDKYKDGYVFIGKGSYTESNFITVSGEIGKDTVTTETFNTDNLLNDCISIKQKEDTLYLLNGKNGKGSLSILNSYGTLVNKMDLDYYPSDIEIREKIYILDSNERKLNVYSDKLELEKSIDITCKFNGVTMFPNNIAISPLNEIYCLLSDKTDSNSVKIMQVSATNKIICDSIDDLDNINDIFIDSSGNIMIVEKNNNKLLVDVIDKNGNIIDMTEINNCDEVYGLTDSDKIIFSNDKGISVFGNDKEELIIDARNLCEKNIYTCNVENDKCTAFLYDTLDDYNAVFLTDKQNNIISEIKADSVDDCFVRDEKIYISGFFENNHTVKIFDNGNMKDTGIALDDLRNKYNIGILPSGYLLLSTYDEKVIYIYSESFEMKNTKKININIDGFLNGNTTLYCYDSKNIYCINEDYNLEMINTGFDENSLFASGNDKYDFIFSVSSGIYGINIADMSSVFLVDYNKEIISDVWSVVITNDNKILMGSFYNVYEANLVEINSDYSEKQNLIFAYKNIGDEDINNLWKRAVKTFNNDSKEYQIEMRGYKSDENSDAESLFELDIVSGKIPDIVSTDLLSDTIITLLKDNALADMYPYIKNDDDLNMEKIYPSILEAYTYEKELYSIPLIIWIGTGVMYNHDNYYDNINTCEHLIDSIENIYDSQNNFVDSRYAEFMTQLYLSEKIDSEYKMLDFSETDIQKIVSFLRNYVPEMALTEFNYSDKNRICQECFFYSIQDYYYFKINSEENYPGSTIKPGYPNSNGLLYSRAGISVMNNCTNKDEAWNFIKTCTRCIENNAESEMYSIKDLNILPDESANTMENFDLFMSGTFINNVIYNKLKNMIYDEMYENPNVSDEIISKSIYNKMKLYFSEIK